MSVNPLAFTLMTAAGFAALATPVVVFWMWRWKVLDVPDSVRKLHGRTVPLAGGLAVLAAGGLAATATLFKFPDILSESTGHFRFLIGLGIACVWVCGLGVADDSRLLRGRQKLLGQVIGALIATAGGCVISRIEFLDLRLELGVLAIPFTVFWLVGAINAVNLIDGIDGLATSVGVILSGTFAGMAILARHPLEAVLAVGLCGALLGFLPYNFPRARIFLGDTGSMLIGLLLGTLALRSSVKSQATLALAAPVSVLSILIFDVGMAILRRKLTGRSLYSSDRGHLHHRLTQLGMSPIHVVAFVSLACLVCSVGALASLTSRNDWIAVSASGAVILGCVAAKVFGHREFLLLLNRAIALGRSLFQFSPATGNCGEMSATQLQGNLDWGPVWRDLRLLALGVDLVRVELQISAPRAHEYFHAEWFRQTDEVDRQWLLTVPVCHQGAIVGRIRLCGEVGSLASQGSVRQMAEIIQGLRPTEIQIEDVLARAIPSVSALQSSVAA